MEKYQFFSIIALGIALFIIIFGVFLELLKIRSSLKQELTVDRTILHDTLDLIHQDNKQYHEKSLSHLEKMKKDKWIN